MNNKIYNLKASLISIFLLISLGILNAQNFGDCGYIDEPGPPLTPAIGCENLSDAWLNNYRTPGYWIPDGNTPIKTVLVNYIVCLKDDGTGGWVDSPEFRDEVDLMFASLNTWYSNSIPKGYSLTCEPTYTHIYDTRIRFELNDIIFIDNSVFNTALSTNAIFDYLELHHPDYKKAMNHFFTMPPQGSTSYWGRYSIDGEYNQSYVITHYSMWDDTQVVWPDHIGHIAHEYGHALGLHHTYNGEYTDITHYDFLDDIFGLCAEPLMIDPNNPCFSSCGEPNEPCPCNPSPNHICYFVDDCFFSNFPEPYPLMSGYPNPRYISPKYAGRMHRDLSCYANTFKIPNSPMHNYVKEKYAYQIPLTISENETWDFAIKMYQDIVIEPGNTLTITCKVKMPINGKIIVKQGAILKVDGGTITTAHDSKWGGIEVWGNRDDNQFEYTGHPLAQGKLILNDALIEHANVAVRNFDYSNQATTAGGIIIAKNCTFQNNSRAISLKPYKNITDFNNVEYDYRATFTNCTFTVDSDYLGGSSYPSWHMMLWGVKGVRINGCIFENNLDNTPSGNAIYSYDAGYNIKGTCTSLVSPCPTGQYNNTTFDGFYRAIESVNSSNALYQIYIRESNFANNGYGIHFRSVNDAVVVGNKFELGIYDDCNYDAGTGIFLDNCKRFAIEDNRFKLLQNAPPAHYVGMHTLNTNNTFDEIYDNKFDDMIVANHAEGKNWNVENTMGLAYYCNKNQNNSWDFYVEKDDGSGKTGIQKNQGSRYYVAGNTFSQSATGHFNNWGSYEIDYYFDLASPAEVPSKLYEVEPYPELLDNTCPNHYGGGGDILLSAAAYQQRASDYNSALSSYNTAYNLYNSTNDSATKRMYEEQMSYYNMLLSRAVYDILRSDLADTLLQAEKFEAWQEELNTYAAAESVVDLYLQQGDFVAAMNKVDSLQIDFVFDAYDSVEYPYYQNLKSLQATWMDQGRTIFELTASEINSLSAIADSSRGVAGAQARGILAFAYDSIYSYSSCAQMPDTTKKSAIFSGDFNNEKSGLFVTAKPNPANNSVTFTFVLPDNVESTSLNLYNANGGLVDKLVLNKSTSKIKYNCSHLKAGVYYYSVSCLNEQMTGKLIIVR
ncbi:MAG: hypothetical protein DRJ05_07890 [Bacteroidetes bacterium]|nr:MAG: hypothetical protein DRJ05_07890 [Bacteroidota bacterium]